MRQIAQRAPWVAIVAAYALCTAAIAQAQDEPSDEDLSELEETADDLEDDAEDESEGEDGGDDEESADGLDGPEDEETEATAAAEEPAEEAESDAADAEAEETPADAEAGLEIANLMETVPEPEDEDDSAEEILVTGSRIKRTGFSQPSAVEVLSRKELEHSGADNMADVIRYMSINSGSELNTDVSTASGGTSQFNLRGLGLNSTLVLLNGRRMVKSATVSTDGTNFVDVNSIPLKAVERIEVLKGGASAIYGSDAVAGVINIITRQDMDGFEVQVGGQTTDDFDHDEWDVALVGGASSERTRANLLVSYFKRQPLRAEDRDFTKNGRNVSLLGQPSAFERQNPDGSRGAGVYLDPTCGTSPLSAPVLDELTELFELCTFNFNPYMMLMIDEQRVNALGTLEFDITDHTQTFFEASYAAGRSFRTLSPSFPLVYPTTIPIDNPYNTEATDFRWLGRPRGGAFPPTRQTFESDTLHTVAGIKGDFGGVAPNTTFEDWGWEVAGTFSRNQFRFGMVDSLQGRLEEALDCDRSEDPELCWNPFGLGAPNSEELYNRVHGEFRSVSNTELRTLSAELTGPLFELPGGDFGFAIGTQLRQESARTDLDHDANQLAYSFLVGGPDFQTEREIKTAYGELAVPALQGLELQAAVRFEDYSDVGSSVDPKFGLSWAPAMTLLGIGSGPDPANVRLRGTYATSFRAPSLLQMNGAHTEIAELFDVGVDENGQPKPNDRSIYRAVRTLGNANLTPETSAALSAGLEWMPIKGLQLILDYWNYNFKDLVIKENAQQLIQRDFACDVADAATCNPAIRRDAAGSVLLVNTNFVNAPNVTASGLDFNLNYKLELGEAGTVSAGGSGSYVISYKIELGGETIEAAGSRNFVNPARSMPQLRVNVPLSWHMDAHTVSFIAHYISGYDNDETRRVIQGPGMVAFVPRDSIDAWVTLDLQYALRIDEGDGMATKITVGLINLLDSDPPALDAGYGFDVFVHDPRGRLIYGRLTQEF